MLTYLLHRVFGAGRIPSDMLPTLQNEGVLYLEEGRRGTITYRNYSTPGRYTSWRKQGFVGALALSSQRIVVYGWSARLMDLLYSEPVSKQVAFSCETPTRLLAAFNANAFHKDRSGQIELRFNTPQAEQALQHLRSKIGAAL